VKVLITTKLFFPVVKLTVVHCLLVLAAAKHWHLHQLDVNNAYIYGDLDEDIYIYIYMQLLSIKGELKVCKLHKSLHSLNFKGSF